MSLSHCGVQLLLLELLLLVEVLLVEAAEAPACPSDAAGVVAPLLLLSWLAGASEDAAAGDAVAGKRPAACAAAVGRQRQRSTHRRQAIVVRHSCQLSLVQLNTSAVLLS